MFQIFSERDTSLFSNERCHVKILKQIFYFFYFTIFLPRKNIIVLIETYVFEKVSMTRCCNHKNTTTLTRTLSKTSKRIRILPQAHHPFHRACRRNNHKHRSTILKSHSNSYESAVNPVLYHWFSCCWKNIDVTKFWEIKNKKYNNIIKF